MENIYTRLIFFGGLSDVTPALNWKANAANQFQKQEHVCRIFSTKSLLKLFQHLRLMMWNSIQKQIWGRICPFDLTAYFSDYFHRKFVNVFMQMSKWFGEHKTVLIHLRGKGNIWLNIPAAVVWHFKCLILMDNNADIKQFLFSWRHSRNSSASLLRLPWQMTESPPYPSKSHSAQLMMFLHCRFTWHWWLIHSPLVMLSCLFWKTGRILKQDKIDRTSLCSKSFIQNMEKFSSRCWKDPSLSIQTFV